MSTRTMEQVFQDHLRKRAAGQLEEDLQRNYAEDVILLCEFGVLHGREAIRRLADRLGFNSQARTMSTSANE